MHVKALKDEVLLQIAKDLEMVPDLCYFNELDKTWEPWGIRTIVSKLDDLGWIKRPEAEVYFSRTYGWSVQTDTLLRHEFRTQKLAMAWCVANGYEPVESED